MTQSGPQSVVGTRQSIRVELEWPIRLPAATAFAGNVITVGQSGGNGALHAMGISLHALKGQVLYILEKPTGSNPIGGMRFLIVDNTSYDAATDDTITLEEYVQGTSKPAYIPTSVLYDWFRIGCTTYGIIPGEWKQSVIDATFEDASLNRMFGVIDEADTPDVVESLKEQWAHGSRNMPSRHQVIFNQEEHPINWNLSCIHGRDLLPAFGHIYDVASKYTAAGVDLILNSYPGENEVTITGLLAGIAVGEYAQVGDDANKDNTEIREVTKLTQELTLVAAGYINCIAGDIGKAVTGTASGHTGTLVSYDNTNRIWVITTIQAFNDGEAVTIAAGGTGAGTLTATVGRRTRLTLDRALRNMHLASDADEKVREVHTECYDDYVTAEGVTHYMSTTSEPIDTMSFGVVKKGELDGVTLQDWYLTYQGGRIVGLDIASTTSQELTVAYKGQAHCAQLDPQYLNPGVHPSVYAAWTPPTMVDTPFWYTAGSAKEPIHWSKSACTVNINGAGAVSFPTVEDLKLGITYDVKTSHVHAYTDYGLRFGRKPIHYLGRASFTQSWSVPLHNKGLYTALLNKSPITFTTTYSVARGTVFTETWLFTVNEQYLSNAGLKLPSEPVESQEILGPPKSITLAVFDKTPYY